MAAPESKHAALNDNFNVDYVIRFRFADTGMRSSIDLVMSHCDGCGACADTV